MTTRNWSAVKGLAGLALAAVLAAPAAAFAGPSPGLPKQASVDGKYCELLRKIKVPADEASYGCFNDWGYWAGTAWAGYTDLPAGYWVYVAPNWYIWGETR